MAAPTTCLIFDLDGTLIDSEPLGNQALLDLLPELDDTVHGLMHRYRGQQMQVVYDDLARRIGRPLDEGFSGRFHERVTALYESNLVAMPGAFEMLSALRLPLCVASNGSLAKMHLGLRITGLKDFFGDAVFSAYEVKRWKPDPGLFLHAAKRMGHPPEGCVVLEDSDTGVAAGIAAGMRVIRYTPGIAPAGPRDVATISHLREFQDALSRGTDARQASGA